MAPFDFVITGFSQMLAGLDGQIEKSDAHLIAKGSTFEDLLGRRLAPDMFPLAAQIQFTCQQAEEPSYYLLGETPRQVSPITSLQEARDQIARTRLRLAQADREAIDRGAARSIALILATGNIFDMTGADYVRDWAVPQFHFHLVASYAIMRHAGVELGKRDYVPHMIRHIRH